MSLGKILKGLGAQVEFSLTLLAGDWDPRRRGTNRLNEWLHGWCRSQDFGYYDLGHNFDRTGTLTLDEIQPNKKGKNIVGNKLAGLTMRALNCI